MGMSLCLRVAFPAVFSKPFELLTAAELFKLYKFTSLLTFAARGILVIGFHRYATCFRHVAVRQIVKM